MIVTPTNDRYKQELFWIESNLSVSQSMEIGCLLLTEMFSYNINKKNPITVKSPKYIQMFNHQAKITNKNS